MTTHNTDNYIQDNSKFKNCPFLDFSIEENRTKLSNEISKLITQAKKDFFSVTSIYKNHSIKTNSIERINSLPEDSSILFTKTIEATTEDCEVALETLKSYFPTWSKTQIETRVKVLESASKIMQERRFELTALLCLEAGKPWSDADGEFCEAVDFLEYYALQAKSLFLKTKMGTIQGEDNFYFYEPRGVALVICPWNFPLAIPCGMFSAAIVTGNPAILKPSEETPLIGKRLYEIFLEAGLPKEASAFIPGKGEIVGDYMSRDVRVSTIVFTGSKEVGLKLIKVGGDTKKGQTHVKRIISEMGGKNSIIIDSDADLDEAVRGTIISAFSYTGQKCSACSKVFIVGEETYLKFRERISAALLSLKVGPTSESANTVGPVINEEAQKRIEKTIAEGKLRGATVSETKLSEDVKKRGNFVCPVVLENLSLSDTISTDEIFGPVLSMYMVESFEEGVKFATLSEYRLTGGVYSRSPKNIDYAYREFNVGNLYINRQCTGALVYRQPFGGAHMSGMGSKAGGPDYLIQFTVPRVVTENTIRRGFAPTS